MTLAKKRFLLILMMAVVTLIIVVGLNWDGLMREYRFWQDFEFIEVNEQGYKEYLHRKSGIVMVLLPGGEFMMGSREDEPGRREDEPLHKVRLSPFLIAKYEVSQEIWEKVMGKNPSNFKGEKLPVERVTWNDCYGNKDSFCKRMRLTLPTEAQWEFACSSGSSTPFSFGSNITIDQVNYSGEYPYNGASKGEDRGKTVAVDFFKANGFGLYNMHGNVWEWCLDVYDGNYYSQPQALEGDKPCTSGSEDRVLHGGSWLYGAEDCRSANRIMRVPSYSSTDFGFRPVYNLTLSR